jgi:hypothetical protein
MWISLAVRTMLAGTASSYCTSHHHWWPVTLIVIEPAELVIEWTARPLTKSPMSRTNRRTTVAKTEAETAVTNRRSRVGSGTRTGESSVGWAISASVARRRERHTTASTTPITSTYTATEIQK